MPRLLIIAALLATLAVACSGGSPPEITPVPVNSELVPGPNRFAIALIENLKPVLEGPGTTLHLAFQFDGETKFERDATFVWAVPNSNGFWVADADFDQEGTWTATGTLTRKGKSRAITYPFSVLPDSETPHIGEAAPPADNLTLVEETNVKRVSTDQEPEPALYQMTISQALDAKKPFLVIFSTPAFCQTQFCGPLLDNVKAVRPQFADRVNFIHIEPYVLDDEGQIVPSPQGGPSIAAPMNAWHLQTEPWVYVVGADGKVVARFEGSASEAELTAALQQTLG